MDVSGILKEAGESASVDCAVCLDDIRFMGETYHFEKPLRVKGVISNNGKSLILRAVCEGEMLTQCARCMKDITVPISFKLDENLVRGTDAETVSEDEDVIVFEGSDVNIDEIAASAFLLNVDSRYLCSEDCRGLCPECGKNLNEGDCGCAEVAVDPRWEALIDIMKKDK